ncbi:unnamed protein product [Camellia sinensis]
MASEPVNVNEFQELARRALPKMYFDFYNGGAEDQHTLRENMEAFRRITLSVVTPLILISEQGHQLTPFFIYFLFIFGIFSVFSQEFL